MSRKTGLGKGLDALLPSQPVIKPEGGVQLIPAHYITRNPHQPRVRFDSEEMSELTASIREHGVIQPLIVTRSGQSDRFMLIAGERRLIAARQAGFTEVPAIIREASEQQLVELALVENVQRADLGPLETAEAFRQLADDFGLSHEEIAARVGKSRVSVTNTLRLLKLPAEVQQSLVEEKISEGHARALLALPSPQSQIAALQTIIKKDLNVRQTEELVRLLGGERPVRSPRPGSSPEIQSLEQRFRERLGTRVTINSRGKGGNLVIYYFSDEELNALIDLILGETD